VAEFPSAREKYFFLVRALPSSFILTMQRYDILIAVHECFTEKVVAVAALASPTLQALGNVQADEA
jgi:hypothetical protein